MTKITHVAVAVILNSEQEVLLALRHKHQHQGGLWEFPGGKVEPNESVYDALIREISEEIGVAITSAKFLLKHSHNYEDKSVLLDVWMVNDFSGVPQGLEGQPLRWCAIEDLAEYDFPTANVAIIQALKSRVK